MSYTKPNELELAQSRSVAVLEPEQGLSIEQAFQAVTSGTVKAEHIAVMKELLAMDAERKFNSAFVALQADMPVIVATSVIPNRGKYAKFEDIMATISSLLTRHGFTVSFSQDFKENRILEICTLSHAAGHSRSNSFAVRAGGRADSDTQADCKASTTAKRNALCNALNIVIRQDCLTAEEDAAIEGAFVTEDIAFELERRVKETNSDVASFLKFAGAKKFSEISASRYDDLDAMLTRKAKAQR